MSQHAAPGWYPDAEPGLERWWNGVEWTVHRRPIDQHLMSPPASAPDPPTGSTIHHDSRRHYRPAHERQGNPIPAAVAIAVTSVIGLMAGALIVVSTTRDSPSRPQALIAGRQEVDREVTLPSRTTVETGQAVAAAPTQPNVISVTGIDDASRDTQLGDTDPGDAEPASNTASSGTPSTAASSSTAAPTTTAPTTAVSTPTTVSTTTTVATIPPTGSLCHPAYEPCLPNGPGDAYDCGDLAAHLTPVLVKDPTVDPYVLDQDGDGQGCESG